MPKAPDFSSGYARSHRVYEYVGTALGVGAILNLGWGLATADKVSGWWVPLTVLVGLLGADFISGFVHWLFDTWGSVNTPVVGQLAIRTFREHHVDERAMTRHDFVETNGHNITLAALPAVVGHLALRQHTLPFALMAMAGFAMACCVAMTSQIHKWAHEEKPGRVVRRLQDAGLIIGARHHDRHHVWPHDTHYCITVGWMNAPLEMVRFFRVLERIITWATGVEPRSEDIVVTVAANPAIVTATRRLPDANSSDIPVRVDGS